MWKDGKMDGMGCFKWPNGNEYLGAYVNDKQHGLGQTSNSKGVQFVGHWLTNCQNGEGYRVEDGEKEAGLWKGGRQMETF
mmetsp:Transcript_14731/g.10627  ORF Transcript_14731/g.10627 Transcript_14731/m.10627 type:complete len:80 (+) Transcript_14731:1311-1550(+)